MSSRWRLALALLAVAVAAPVGGATPPDPTDQPTIVVEVTDSGFHWLDAVIGAIAALAVALLVVGLALTVRQLNGRRRET